jgi:hypothetical protein
LLRAPALLFPVRETSQDCGLRTAEGGYDWKLCTRSAHLRTLLDVEFDSLEWLAAIVPGVVTWNPTSSNDVHSNP